MTLCCRPHDICDGVVRWRPPHFIWLLSDGLIFMPAPHKETERRPRDFSQASGGRWWCLSQFEASGWFIGYQEMIRELPLRYDAALNARAKMPRHRPQFWRYTQPPVLPYTSASESAYAIKTKDYLPQFTRQPLRRQAIWPALLAWCHILTGERFSLPRKLANDLCVSPHENMRLRFWLLSAYSFDDSGHREMTMREAWFGATRACRMAVATRRARASGLMP